MTGRGERHTLIAEILDALDAGDWHAADEPSKRLLELMPTGEFALACRAVAVRGLEGARVAAPIAIEALEHGLTSAPLLFRIRDLLAAAGEEEHAAMATAVLAIVGAPPVMESSLQSRHAAFRSLVSSVDRQAHPNSARAITRALALARIGRHTEATAELERFADHTHFGQVDLVLTRGLLACKIGNFDAAIRILTAVRTPEGPGISHAVATLLDPAASREVVLRIARELGQSIRSETPEHVSGVARAVGATLFSMAGDADAATSMIREVSPWCRHLSVVNLAFATSMVESNPMQATWHWIAASEWDETGDSSLPWGEAIGDRLESALNRRPRSLSRAQSVYEMQRRRSCAQKGAQ